MLSSPSLTWLELDLAQGAGHKAQSTGMPSRGDTRAAGVLSESCRAGAAPHRQRATSAGSQGTLLPPSP